MPFLATVLPAAVRMCRTAAATVGAARVVVGTAVTLVGATVGPFRAAQRVPTALLA